jgi:ribosomal-protein-alanine N-acetyltransferase
MITIREMQIDDLEQVMPIEEANFSIPWTETGFFTFLIRDDALFLVAEEDGEILGYLGILISFDESEITNVCVAEKARRSDAGEKGARDSSGCAHRQYAGAESV